MQGSDSSFATSSPAAASARPLPARTQTLLNRLQSQLERQLEIPLQECLITLGEHISTQSSRTHSSERQAEFSSLAFSANKQAPAFSSAFLQSVRRSLLSLQESAPPRVRAQQTDELSLVDDVSVDIDIVLRDIARRETSRQQEALICLAQRFAVLGECPVWDVERLPLSPAWITRRLAEACHDLPMEPRTVLRLYQVFAGRMTQPLAEMVHQANELLQAEGILPGLEDKPINARMPGPRRRHPQFAGNGDAGDGGYGGTAAEPQTKPPLNPSAGNAASIPWLQALQDAFSGEQGTVHSADHALSVLQQVVAAAVGLGQPAADPVTAAGAELSSEAVSRLLARLQSLTANNAHASHRSIEDIRTALLAQARAENAGQAKLAPRDDNTLGLIAMLYRNLRQFMHPASAASDLLAQLQLPLVRTAMDDPHFFVRGEHPIRELLNAVAEAGATWQTPDDIDPQWMLKLGQAVQQVVDDYDGDEQVFVEINQSLLAQRQAVIRRAELAERRFIEAARGRERMSVARKQAVAAIEQACATQPGPPPLVARVLRQAWTDVLMLTLLRQGAASEQWEQQLVTTARIVAVTSKHAAHMRDKELGSEIEVALTQVGCLGEEASAFARCLSTPGGSAGLMQDELVQRLDARTRLGAAKDAHSDEPLDDLLDIDEDACLQHLLALPHGSWFEFAGPPPLEWRRLRLSWFSQVSGNALFVNPRGQKVTEPSLDQLARDMAADRLRLVPSNQPRLIDQAWQATLHELRRQTEALNDKETV